MQSTRKSKILIVDDDSSVQASLSLLLKQAGFDVLCADEPQSALKQLNESVDLVLQDMNFSMQTSGEEGLQLLAKIKQQAPHTPVLLMTAWGSIALAVKGVKAGAADFFTKPWQNAQLLEIIKITLQLHVQNGDANLNRQSLDRLFNFGGLIGEHPEFLRVLATIGQVAKTKASILILGESGTGKELVANAIHANSPRAERTAVKVNMGAITPSLFESEMFGHVKGAFTDAKSDRKGHIAAANESTLFLDEIGELGKSEQVKLLRVLQDHRYQPVGSSRTEQADIRVVSATNRELAESVASGEFREDLFYRINLITIRVPALRERRSDIALIARQLLKQISVEYSVVSVSLSVQAVEWLSAQTWPGNVRQLKQTLERTLLLANKSVLDQSDFIAAEQHEKPATASPQTVQGLTLDQVEKKLLENALLVHNGNISQVAKAVGLSRASVYRRIAKHGLDAGSEAES